MQEKLRKQEVSAHEIATYEKMIPEPYKNTIQQITKNCKLEQKNLKLEDETNFTKEKFKVLNEKHKQDVMDKNDPVRVIVKKQQQKIDKRIIDLNLLNEQ